MIGSKMSELMMDGDFEAELAEIERIMEEQPPVPPIPGYLPSQLLDEGDREEFEQTNIAAKDAIDYRRYYYGIPEEFKKSEDCIFAFVEIKADNPQLEAILEKNQVMLAFLKEQCKEVHSSYMLCHNQDTQIWTELRKLRCTASMFGRVAKRRKLDPPDTMLKFMQKNLNPVRYKGGIESCIFGKLSENKAAIAYEKLRPNIQLKPTGFWTCPQYPWLGGSPDGLIYDRETEEDGLLEIKCLDREKGKSFEQIASKKGFYMLRQRDGTYSLDKNDEYYHQIQGCLNILGRKFCDLAILTEVDMYIHRVYQDKSFFEGLLPKLKEYYFRYQLPYIADKPVLEGRTWTYKFLSKEVYDLYYK
jgi:hypothetical protein